MTEFKDTTNRHLRHKLQSLGRRLDELEEATSKLQKAEDELLDLQDKIIQAEGSNSSLLGDVEALRKRVLKIEGKDEEVRKAEDLCRLIKEKLEEEENLTKELKAEIERLQLRMTELEKLEEAFGKSKSDCTQLCLSLNEEKNLTKKLSAELEALKARVKEVDSSEASLNRAEQALTTEMEKLKSLTQTFVAERKKLLEKQREDEKIILKLTEKLEHQKSKVGSLDHSFNESHDLIIEDDLPAGLSSKLARKKKLSHDVGLRNKSENEKNSLEGQEDNKIKDLTQEVQNLKSRLKQLEVVEEDLKNTESKNAELEEKFQQERSRNQVLNDQLEQLKIQLLSTNSSSNGSLVVSNATNVLENGKAETEEINIRGGLRQEKKSKILAATEAVNPKFKKRDNSPQQLKLKSKELSQSTEKSPTRRAQSPAHKPKKTGLKSGSSSTADSGLKDGNSIEEKHGSAFQATSVASSDKKVSVLSRYPPAASDQKPVKVSGKPGNPESKKASRVVSPPEKDRATETESSGPPQEVTTVLSLSQANGSYTAYRSHVTSTGLIEHGSEGHSSASETESVGSKRSVGEQDTAPVISILSGRTTDSKYPRYARLQDSHSGGSSTRSSYDEEQHRALMMEGGSQEPFQTSTGIEIQRVCSPREALCSKVLIKPAIIEYDRKEMMSGGNMEPTHTNEKPKIATKPNKMTSSITFYPNDPSSSRTSSRSSSISSEPPSKERHTSTSNIVIGPNTELRGSITIPYEISIPKSEITLRSGDGDNDDSDVIMTTLPNVLETARIETTILSRSSLNFQSPEIGSELNNSESGFESSGGITTTTTTTTTTVTSRRSHNNDQCSSQEDDVPEMRNVTIRSAWRNRGAVSMDQLGQGPRHDGLEDETESTTTWRAYRATTVLDTDENLMSPSVTTRSGKPSPAERYMRRISSGNTGRESLESSRRNKSVSPIDSSLQRIIPHEPVCAQQLQPRMRKEPPAVDESEPAVTSWRRQSAGEVNSSERLRGRGAWTGKASAGDGSRPWSSRHHDN
ncbi:leucine zipper protein 1 [Pangasianodon hypophthalmus]|uniref:leucine zipper protein 1 n=1 Tax=Pangasianodon hypophthalmus TaxID=310915 RepID=UPI002307271F|nr:leucine zipper protein 1 [Pangasianodon hypophthalmus]XP_034164272.2 leucine zipper protein 1 [Pangasianodon hypophthalmus]XP_053093519.1 leucine zipper protein 1 [Pangasianodon hypophthalmus]XP_053093520.1 leucine zipper protein 1 [Pangasianodon hypophthalmus]